MSQQKIRKERRLRVKLMDSVKEGQIMLNEKTAQELEIKDSAEIVVGGKKRLVLSIITSSEVPAEQVYINPQDAKRSGIADNSTATIRKAS